MTSPVPLITSRRLAVSTRTTGAAAAAVGATVVEVGGTLASVVVGPRAVVETGIVVLVPCGDASAPWQAAATRAMASSHPMVGIRRFTDMNRTSAVREPA